VLKMCILNSLKIQKFAKKESARLSELLVKARYSLTPDSRATIVPVARGVIFAETDDVSRPLKRLLARGWSRLMFVRYLSL
jgi:hypothetical protein